MSSTINKTENGSALVSHVDREHNNRVPYPIDDARLCLFSCILGFASNDQELLAARYAITKDELNSLYSLN